VLTIYSAVQRTHRPAYVVKQGERSPSLDVPERFDSILSAVREIDDPIGTFQLTTAGFSKLARRWCAGASPRRTQRRARFREWGFHPTLGRGAAAPAPPGAEPRPKGRGFALS